MLNKIALTMQKLTGSVLGLFMMMMPLGNILVCVSMLLFGAGYILALLPLDA